MRMNIQSTSVQFFFFFFFFFSDVLCVHLISNYSIRFSFCCRCNRITDRFLPIIFLLFFLKFFSLCMCLSPLNDATILIFFGNSNATAIKGLCKHKLFHAPTKNRKNNNENKNETKTMTIFILLSFYTIRKFGLTFFFPHAHTKQIM